MKNKKSLNIRNNFNPWGPPAQGIKRYNKHSFRLSPLLGSPAAQKRQVTMCSAQLSSRREIAAHHVCSVSFEDVMYR